MFQRPTEKKGRGDLQWRTSREDGGVETEGGGKRKDKGETTRDKNHDMFGARENDHTEHPDAWRDHRFQD